MKIIISNVKNQPIYEQIYEQIKNLIITEELKAGEMLPSIRGLAMSLRKMDLLILWQEKAVLWRRRIWELIKEENLKKVEQYLEKAVKLSRTCGLTKR